MIVFHKLFNYELVLLSHITDFLQMKSLKLLWAVIFPHIHLFPPKNVVSSLQRGQFSWLNLLVKCFLILECVNVQKQLPRSALVKGCFENMQQIYRRKPIPICDFNKVALQLYLNRPSAWVFCCKFSAYFQNNFS